MNRRSRRIRCPSCKRIETVYLEELDTLPADTTNPALACLLCQRCSRIAITELFLLFNDTRVATEWDERWEPTTEALAMEGGNHVHSP